MVCDLLQHVLAEQLRCQNSEDSMHSGMACGKPASVAEVQLSFHKQCHSIHSGKHCGIALHVAGELYVYQRRQNTHHTDMADSLVYREYGEGKVQSRQHNYRYYLKLTVHIFNIPSHCIPKTLSHNRTTLYFTNTAPLSC